MSGASILVVDDYPANLKLAQLLLEKAGYAVLTASSAEQALQLIAASVPALMLIDIRLPGMDGLELTHKLKANPVTAHMVIVALTASNTKEDEERARAAGCDGYVSKPINARLLSSSISEKWLAAPNAGGSH